MLTESRAWHARSLFCEASFRISEKIMNANYKAPYAYVTLKNMQTYRFYLYTCRPEYKHYYLMDSMSSTQ